MSEIKIRGVSLKSVNITGATAPTTVPIRYTPEIAAEILAKCNNVNRHCPKKAVDRIASDLKNNNYAYTHQGVAFDRQGNLLDGQTRLQAIVTSGVSAVIMSTFNLPEAAHRVDEAGRWKKIKTEGVRTQDMVDHGRVRSFADLLHFEQINNEEETDNKRNRDITAIVKKVASLSVGLTGLPIAQLKDTMDLFKEDIQQVLDTRNKLKPPTQYANNVITACLVFARQADPEVIDRLTTQLYTGTHLAQGEPVYMMREKLADLPKRGNISRENLIIRICLFCITKAILEEPVHNLKIRDDMARDAIRSMMENTISELQRITGTEPKDETIPQIG